MSDLLRETAFGQLVRLVTKKKYFQYPEEKADFELPPSYVESMKSSGEPTEKETKPARRDSSSSRSDVIPTPNGDAEKQDGDHLAPSRTAATAANAGDTKNGDGGATSLKRTKSVPIAPTKTSDGVILVDFYATDDPANPQNWSRGKRNWTTLVICIYTFVVYTGSAIYTPGAEGVQRKWGVGPVPASLPLALYVLAYGVAPLLWSPLSEIPSIGRSPVYIATMACFVLLSIGPPLTDSFAGFLVLRFFQGFFGSPCLATGGATLQDMYSLLYLPYALTAWVSAAYGGPALGPLISGFAVAAKGWRWGLWEILWMAGPVFLLMFFFLPETSTPNILYRRAARLRALTGDNRLMAQSEINQKSMKPSHVFVDAVIKPLEITIKDPAVAFVNVYAAIIYGIYYSFFEVFPLVYPVYYGMGLGDIGLVFTCILIACIFGVVIYVGYMHFYLIPDIKKNGLRAQEHRLVPALFNVFGAPIGLFLFAWTARASIQWAVPTLGIIIYAASGFVVFQCIFVYVPLSYPQYAASLFAANDFFRSSFACAAILFARPLFINVGIAKGVSTLAGLSVIGVIGMFILYFQGAKLRAKSKFAVA